eukprot:2540037-Prymnesium_polylepis.1
MAYGAPCGGSGRYARPAVPGEVRADARGILHGWRARFLVIASVGLSMHTRCMRKPFGEPAATVRSGPSARMRSRLHAGAQRHACPAFAASSPSSRTAPT